VAPVAVTVVMSSTFTNILFIGDSGAATAVLVHGNFINFAIVLLF
jgi:hypothetical protein